MKKRIVISILVILTLLINKEVFAVNDIEENDIVNEESNIVVEDNNTIDNKDVSNTEVTNKEELTGVTVNGKQLDDGNSITVENEVTSVSVYGQGTALYYISVNGKSVSGNSVKIEEGSNTIIVKDGNGKTITVYVTRKEEDKKEKNNKTENTVFDEKVEHTEETITSNEGNKENLYLINIKIDGFELSPSFKCDVYSYTINVNMNENDIDKLNIVAVPNKSTASVTVDGTDNLVEGENIINIILKSSDGKEIKAYQIIVNKNSTESILKKSNENTIIISVLAVIAIIILIIIMSKAKKKKSKKKDVKTRNNKGRHS